MSYRCADVTREGISLVRRWWGGCPWSGTGRVYSLLTSAMLEVSMDATGVAVVAH